MAAYAAGIRTAAVKRAAGHTVVVERLRGVADRMTAALLIHGVAGHTAALLAHAGTALLLNARREDKQIIRFKPNNLNCSFVFLIYI